MAIEGRSDAIHGGRIRLGMVGGGQGAFIGAVHRIAARMDDQYVLVAGALSSDPERAKASGEELGLDPQRTYADFRVMAKEESKRNDGIEAVSIVTPNHLHFPVSKAFMEAGIHVICDKPLVHTSREAKAPSQTRRRGASPRTCESRSRYRTRYLTRRARVISMRTAIGRRRGRGGRRPT